MKVTDPKPYFAKLGDSPIIGKPKKLTAKRLAEITQEQIQRNRTYKMEQLSNIGSLFLELMEKADDFIKRNHE